jgi:succinoglycan biosynthesis protein ExoA
MPNVAIIVPALNESAYIVGCLETLIAQRGCTISDIIVADGGSDDDTVALAWTVSLRDHRVRVVDNPGCIQAAGFNTAAALADPGADILVRADAHVTYAPDFVAKCLAAMAAQDATTVVVPMRTVARAGEGFQRAVAAAQNNRLGNGGAPHRARGASGLVAHGHHAVFDRAFFDRLGGYDTRFSHNEDAEFDVRAHRAGGRIWMCAEARVDYYPRGTMRGLVRQYAHNGRGRARTLLLHRLRPGPRQMAPALLLPLLAACCLLAPLWPPLALAPLAYAAACLCTGLAMAVGRRDVWLLAVGPAAMMMHAGFAWGYATQLLDRHNRAGRAAPRLPVGSPLGAP